MTDKFPAGEGWLRGKDGLAGTAVTPDRLRATGRVEARLDGGLRILEPDAFVVPEGLQLVVTDYWFAYNDATPDTMWLFKLEIDHPAGSREAAAICATTTNQRRSGTACWTGTTGFVVASGGSLVGELGLVSSAAFASPSFIDPIVRGYLVGKLAGPSDKFKPGR